MKIKFLIVFLIASLFLTTAPLSFAQTSPNDWSAVQNLAAGTDLIVKTVNGQTVHGSILQATANEVELSVKGKSVSLSKNKIAALYSAVAKSGKRSKNIGLITGALVGAGAAGFINKDAVYEADYNYSAAVLLTAAGGAVGFFVGRLFGKGKKKGVLIYKAK